MRKSDRLRKRSEYLKVQRRGRRVQLKHLLALVTEQPDGLRVGLTVSKRVGNAVTRNRVKRLVREVWRRAKGAMPGRLDIVLIAKKRAAEATYADLRRDVESLAKRLSGL